MNEFEGKSKEELNTIKFGLEQYKKGSVSSFNLIIDYIKVTIDMTENFYDSKISACQSEIDKLI